MSIPEHLQIARTDHKGEVMRNRIIDAGVSLLAEEGVAATTTMAVQRRADVSRGALLHHFPTRETLLVAIVQELVHRNEKAVREALALAPPDTEPLTLALRVFMAVLHRPAFGAEQELWAVARHEPWLRELLRTEEAKAGVAMGRLIDDILGPQITSSPGFPLVAALTTELVRGMAISQVLHKDPTRRDHLLDQWLTISRALLNGDIQLATDPE